MKEIINTLSHDIESRLIPSKYELLPNLNDLYELKLAFYESLILSPEELQKRGAYFAQINNKYTRHFLMCTGSPIKLPDHSSSRLKSFFEKNIFRTGYATHGLFPYRGKFHPQMIKGLINMMGIKEGEIVLDPMMGSGTVPVEASLIGVNTVGLDASPFCRFMSQTKIDTLTMSLTRVEKALANYKDIFDYFQNKIGKPHAGSKGYKRKTNSFLETMEPISKYVSAYNYNNLTQKEQEASDTHNFLLLAFLDSSGYAERSSRKSPLEHFRAVIERYFFVVKKIQTVLQGYESELGKAKVFEGDARSIPVETNSIDGIIFSPPYSFAIDYLKNDSFHLKAFEVNIEDLRKKMIGLRGYKLEEKYNLYIEDMKKVISECSRVLKKGRICTIIIGTNNNQLSKIFAVSPEKVKGLHEKMINLAAEFNMKLVKKISRSIIGISNTMRREYILLFLNN